MNSVVSQFVVGLSSLFPHRMWNPIGGFCCLDPRGDGVYHHPGLLSVVYYSALHMKRVQPKPNWSASIICWSLFDTSKVGRKGKWHANCLICWSSTIFAIVDMQIVWFSFKQTWFQFLIMLRIIMSGGLANSF